MATPIRPRDLPAGTPGDTAALIFDSGSQVLKSTPVDLVNAATPLASQAEAEAGVDNNKRVTPLRVRQAVESYGVLSSSLSSASGAGLSGFSYATAYPSGSVGAALKNIILASLPPFNVVGDDATDNASGINAALAYAHSLGGGDVILPAGRIRHSVTIDNKYPRVRLIGTGDANFHDSGADVIKTLLVPTFAGTAAKLRTPYAAEQGVAVGSTYKYTGGGFLNVAFDGMGLATKALEVDSVSLFEIDVYATGFVGTDVYEMKCGITGVDLGEATDVAYSRANFRARQIDTPAERAANIVKLTGSINANVCKNMAPLFGIAINAQHWNGHCLYGVSADNNDIYVEAARPGGTGKSVYACAPNAAHPVGFEWNRITYLTGTGGAHAEGIDTAGAVGPIYNEIDELDSSNGSPAPTAGNGSHWKYEDSYDVTAGSAFQKTAFADDPNVARAQRAALGGETVRVYNGSEAQILLTDGTRSWGINIQASTGDIRMTRIAGAGAVNVGNGAPVKIGGKLVSEGAADSGGTGFKVLRVPN